MALALLLTRLTIAGVLATAGLAKLLDRAGSREALAGLGVPGRWAVPVGIALPATELAVALALLPRRSAWWAALAALALFVLFTAAVGRALARGQRPDCRCFGQLAPSPIGGWTLARNGGLIVLALFVLVAGRPDPGPSAGGWLLALDPASRALAAIGLVAVALLVAVAVMAAHTLRRQGEILTRLAALEEQVEAGGGAGPTAREDAEPPDKGLPVGAPAPAFALPDLDGQRRSLAGLLERGRAVLLLFVGPACDPCLALVPEIAGWQREHAAGLTLVLVSSGPATDNRAKFGALDPGTVLLQADAEVATAYAALWTPGAVVIRRNGRLASAVAYGDAAVRGLVARAIAAGDAPWVAPEERRASGGLALVRRGPPGPGEPAPPLARPDLDGREIDLADYRGRDTLVVFWQPQCPHCQRLAEDLRRWEAEPPRGAPRLLVVSSGSIEENRALGLRSTVVLDEGFTIGKAFGARGTPSAVLVDGDGRIASTVGVGARDVLALAGVVPVVGATDAGFPAA
jgi:peroxiredoxin